eukprot:1723188-Lingulodinium_polyedra.AAC.1
MRRKTTTRQTTTTHRNANKTTPCHAIPQTPHSTKTHCDSRQRDTTRHGAAQHHNSTTPQNNTPHENT